MTTKIGDTAKIDRLAGAINLILWKLDRDESSDSRGIVFQPAKIDRNDVVIRKARDVMRDLGLL